MPFTTLGTIALDEDVARFEIIVAKNNMLFEFKVSVDQLNLVHFFQLRLHDEGVRRRCSTEFGLVGIRVGVSTILVSENSRGDLVGLGDVNTISQPAKDTLSNSVTKKSPLDNGVVVLVGSLGKNVVTSVGHQHLSVGVVRSKTLNLVDQVLVEVGLADMAAVDVVSECLVLEQSSVCMSQKVNVGCTAGVVTWEECLKLSNAILVSLLDTTTKGGVNVGLVVGVSIAWVVHTSIDTGCVAVPNIEIQLWYRLAGLDVDDLVVEDEVNTLLVLLEVATNGLTTDVLEFNLGGQNARVLSSKQSLGRCVGRITQVGLIVVRVEHVLEITLLDTTWSHIRKARVK
ncbi:hypothetical protein HG531_005901 [Fusarium graminearum]|nr:hypothetical protein HG531_005901 [Fusarium graminearum]